MNPTKTRIPTGLVLLALALSSAAAAGEPDPWPIGGSGFAGGLCVFVGTEDLQAAVAVGRTGRFLVEVLATHRTDLPAARKTVRDAGVYGLVSVGVLDANTLPYAEDLVNVLVVPAAGNGRSIPAAEIARVLRPGGVAIASTVGAGGVRFRKPRPAGMGDWTHPRHSAAGNAVSGDELVAPPRRVRWLAGPSVEVANHVTAAGRSYYGGLWARDSFNGLRLWDRKLRPSPAKGNFGYRAARGSVPPVAAGEEVLVVTDGGLRALNGATGETVREYPEAGVPRTVLHESGSVVAADAASVRALGLAGAALRWKRDASEPKWTVAGDGGVFYIDGSPRRGQGLTATSLDLGSGEVRWQMSHPWLAKVRRLVLGAGVLVYEVSTLADEPKGNAIHVADASDGRELWSRTFVPGASHMKQARAMIVGETLWVLEYGRTFGLDVRTGKERAVLPAGRTHCFPPVATARYLLSGELDLTNLETGEVDAHRITKAACGRDAGWVPANGLLYFTPKHCVCWPMLRGYTALAPRRPAGPPEPPTPETCKPSPGEAAAPSPRTDGEDPGAWPCYRRDAWRGAAAPEPVGGVDAVLWETPLGDRPADSPVARDWRENPFVRGPVTPPVAAGDVVVVARPDAHQVVALDARTGKVRWRYDAAGRVDSAPTLHRGLCLFGTSAGRVLCLRADDGRVVWRLDAAPGDERIVAWGQLESPWPVAGSVLVAGDTAFFAAGRQPLADGGVHVFAVDPPTGKVRWVRSVRALSQVHSRKYTTKKKDAKGFASHRFLYCSNGLEFDPVDLMHRENGSVAMSRWTFAVADGKRKDKPTEAFALLKPGPRGVVVPRGVWSYGQRNQMRVRGGEIQTRPLAVWRDGTVIGCLGDRRTVFRRDFTPASAAKLSRTWFTGWAQGSHAGKKKGEVWRCDRLAKGAAWRVDGLPGGGKGSRIAAMILAGEKLYAVAARGGMVILSAETGKLLARRETPAPVHDGLAAAGGRLILSARDGRVLCLGADK